MAGDDFLNLDENGKKNLKKPLIYGAAGLFVFIIGVVVFALFNPTSKNENVVLPPQIEENQQKNNDDMFKDVPIDTDTNVEEKNDTTLADKLIANEEKKEKTLPIQQPEPQVKETQPKEKQVKEEKPKVEEVKEVKKQTPKANYYIQVAALIKHKKPNKRFLELIKKEGFDYKLYHTYYVKDGKKIEIVKVLIGPFTKDEVKKELKKVKDTITQNAFIYKVK
ncbi:MAG: hypothetical protein ABGX26_08260 [Nautiliaceae bacterium]